ncbi:ALG6, ALG8 glycosyltransferase family [Actinidia rufa]|uniref:Alpha-1,3-glucosyltransferase n=1 Tax=Actinidia rufa TaxID=165716 RepID=A0A7J0EV65_9ERIC|nr:ALG6, ALG8 glycosyltransferase family [Actinidia rufa]
MTGAKNPKTTISIPNPIVDLAWFSLIATCVKLLLIPSYHSSDFEVHRHWLALTHSLSLPNWYLDETSPWTLDYPPFFAYFERFLSLFAKLVDPTIVDLHDGLNYKSPSVIIFQRLTVMVSDMVLIFGIYRLGRKLGSRERNLIWILVVWSPGLLIVDHMHFQYNGFLLGILLVSLSCLEDGRDLAGGFVFAVLLCFKHLFAVAGPVCFVYLLRHYCREGGLGVRAVGGYGDGGRGGFCGSLWAICVFWADKGLAFVLTKLGFTIQVPTASFTGGLVGDSSPFAVLPRVTPLITFVLVLVALFPCLIKAWRNPQPSMMITRWVAYAYTCGFLFGWHVHEKASLHFAIPLAIVATQSMEDARHYFILSIVSCYSLFPLLFEAQEYPIKVLLLLLHSILMWFGFSSQFSQITSAKARATGQKKGDKSGLKESPGTVMQKQAFSIGWIGTSYLFGLLVVETWGRFLHPIFLDESLARADLYLARVPSNSTLLTR